MNGLCLYRSLARWPTLAPRAPPASVAWRQPGYLIQAVKGESQSKASLSIISTNSVVGETSILVGWRLGSRGIPCYTRNESPIGLLVLL